MEETTEQVRDYTGVTTKQIIVEMLTENTGSHFLDSGGAYGRHWQRNQGLDFDSEPAFSTDWSVWAPDNAPGPKAKASCCASVSLYHWMNFALEFDAELQGKLDCFIRDEAVDDWSWLQIQEEFADSLWKEGVLDHEPNTINTYNNPDYIDLDQVLQYVALTEDGEYEPTHMIVSVHGGCDVRGGYGAPKVFRLRHDEGEVWDAARVSSIWINNEAGTGWESHGPCMSYLNKYEQEDSPLPDDLFSLPAYKLDWITGTEAVEVRDALESIPAQIKALDAQLEPLRGTLLASLNRTKVQLEAELIERASAWLIEAHGEALFVQGDRLYLASPHLVDECGGYLEVHAGNIYL